MKNYSRIKQGYYKELHISKFLIILFVIVISSVVTCHAEQPDKSFLQSKINCGNGYTYVDEFVNVGLNAGKWNKIANDIWLYKISSYDKATNRNNNVAIQFAKDGNKVVINRLVADGIEQRINTIINFYSNICIQMPTFKKSTAEYYEKQKEVERSKAESDNVNFYYEKLIGKYLLQNKYDIDNSSFNENDGDVESEPVDIDMDGNSSVNDNNNSKNFNKYTKIININSIDIDGAKIEFLSKFNDIVVCRIPIENASINQQYGHNFELLSTEGSCQIKIIASTPMIDHSLSDIDDTSVSIKYRGNCDDFCDYTSIDKTNADYKNNFDPSGDSFEDLKFTEKIKKANKVKKEESWK